MPRPTRKAISLTLGAIVLFGVGANAQAGWLYVIGASLVGVVAAGILLPRSAISGLEVERRVPEFATVGERIDVTLSIRNTTRAGKMAFSAADRFIGETSFLVRSIAAGSRVDLRYGETVARRGKHRAGDVDLSSGAPFGIASAKRKLTVASPMTVHPRWVPLTSFPLLESASAPNESMHDRSRRGAGMDFYGLREYRPGDSPRFVHWASTARGGRLLVREFEEQLASRLTILIDASSAIGEEPTTTFEDAVSAAASLVVYALDVGHPVQLFADAKSGLRHLFEPTKVQALDWLAEIEADGRRGLMRTAEALRAEVFRRSTVVMLFPSTVRNLTEAPEAASILQQGGARVISVVVAAHTFGGGRDVLPSEGVEDLVGAMGSGRSIVFRIDSGKELGSCLRSPVLV